MSFNFNGVNKNKVYMNGVEVTKAYMNGVEFYTSDAVYQLNFDSSNQDYLGLNKPIISNGFIVLEFEVREPSVENEYIFSSFSGVGSDVRSYIRPSDQVLRVVGCSLDELLINGVSFPIGTSLADHYNKKIKVTYTVVSSTEVRYVSSYSFSQGFFNGVLHSIKLDDETFPLSEGSGNTITGDSGTVATINTSNASGIDYINSNIWEEIVPQYELNFDSSNQDYIELNTSLNWTNTNDLDFEIAFLYQSGQSFNLLSIGTVNVNGVYLQIVSSGGLLFRQYSDTQGNVSFNTGFCVDGINTLKVKNGISTLNGDDTTITQISDINIVNGKSYLGRFFTFNNYYSYTLRGVTIQDETFPLSEGSGNTITGSNGTIGTINTSNAAGIDYIDANVWEEIT